MINLWQYGGFDQNKKQVRLSLEARPYRLRIDYFQGALAYKIALYWSRRGNIQNTAT